MLIKNGDVHYLCDSKIFRQMSQHKSISNDKKTHLFNPSFPLCQNTLHHKSERTSILF